MVRVTGSPAGILGVRLRRMLALAVLPVLAIPGPLRAQANATAVDPPRFSAALDAERGHVVLVNFWATWCRSCRQEIPALRELEREYRDQGLRLVLVTLDEPGDYAGVVAPFLARWFPDLPTYRRVGGDMDALVSVLDPAWNEVLPTTYVLDRSGAVRARLQGGKPAAAFREAIRPWLAEDGEARSRVRP